MKALRQIIVSGSQQVAAQILTIRERVEN